MAQIAPGLIRATTPLRCLHPRRLLEILDYLTPLADDQFESRINNRAHSLHDYLKTQRDGETLHDHSSIYSLPKHEIFPGIDQS